jgi:formate hydrogenlyase subunit 4
VLSGWSSNNKYSLLGGLRSAAQMVSYELPMGLSVIGGLLIASGMMAFKHTGKGDIFNLSLSRVADSQAGGFWNWAAFNWKFAFLGFILLLIFYICGLAETNRAPFDLPEAETELIGGYHTEYGGLRWAMFFLGEYAAMLNVSAVATTLFLGGWHAPYPDALFIPLNSPLYALQGIFWFGLKVFIIIAVYIWLRASLPRLRYDQLMLFTWKGLLPTTLGIVLVIAAGLTVFAKEAPPAALLQSASSGGATNLPAVPGGINQFPTAPMPGGMTPPFGAGGNPHAMPGGAPPGLTMPGGAMPGGAMPGGTMPGGTMPAIPGGAMPGGAAPAPSGAAPGGPAIHGGFSTAPAPGSSGSAPGGAAHPSGSR